MITAGGVTYHDQPWHKECFLCTGCEKQLAGQRFISKDEHPYCLECFSRRYAKKCVACTKSITGNCWLPNWQNTVHILMVIMAEASLLYNHWQHLCSLLLTDEHRVLKLFMVNWRAVLLPQDIYMIMRKWPCCHNSWAVMRFRLKRNVTVHNKILATCLVPSFVSVRSCIIYLLSQHPGSYPMLLFSGACSRIFPLLPFPLQHPEYSQNLSHEIRGPFGADFEGA